MSVIKKGVAFKFMTDDTPPTYILQRMIDSDTEAALQRKRGQSKPRRITYRNQSTE